ncbi:FecR domain-containing protein [Mesorhizobium sangaii]|uniref:Ferric-dicitrate binding protein FerR (Iron transport regulator) n=1 Tax=Mesorhizobium sangaii TaxID=505389 RepID=A0A841PF02_9HYPH|nr:FecR domain-containing protein [Mesorhizobium sangaii]MBB6412381.1 ferric-dicitrate binding protein FerR (iron transport regulator) [Mesorhizobium sangaii]
MSARDRFFRSLVAGVFAGVFWMDAALAQGAGCAFAPVAGTSRQIVRCQEGLTIIVEGGARFTLVDRDRNGKVDAVRLRRKALLLDAPAGSIPAGFAVVTPQAIAAARGTKWAVDVGRGKTSVFVLRGRVAVNRPASRAGVVLAPGDGVDVEAGTGPLTVKRWPAKRVSALLARFGQ